MILVVTLEAEELTLIPGEGLEEEGKMEKKRREKEILDFGFGFEKLKEYSY